MDTFPLDGDPLPKKKDGSSYNGWLLFFDELPAATRAVQAAAYKILLDRKVGQADLHENVYMCGAGNLETDGAVSFGMSTALKSRLIHINLEVRAPDWLAWALSNNVHQYITSYINFKSNALYTFDPNSPDNTYASPRTWAFLSRLMDNGLDMSTPEGSALAQGTIGTVSKEFKAFIANYGKLPKLADIIADPDKVDMPSEPGTLYALCGSLSTWVDASNISPIYRYLARMPAEYQVVTIKDAVKRSPSVRNTPEMKGWIAKNATALYS